MCCKASCICLIRCLKGHKSGSYYFKKQLYYLKVIIIFERNLNSIFLRGRNVLLMFNQIIKMKKVLNLTMVALLGLFLFACTGNNTTTEDEKQDETTNENIPEEDNGNEDDVEEATNVLEIGKIKNGDDFMGLKVTNYELEEGHSFSFALEGEFVVTGTIVIDEMWGEFGIEIIEEYNPYKDLMIDIDGFKKQLITFCYFANQDEFAAALDSEDLYMLEQGNTITLTVKVKDFAVGGKFEGYGDSNLHFVEIVHE